MRSLPDTEVSMRSSLANFFPSNASMSGWHIAHAAGSSESRALRHIWIYP
jgi:hypothetical protein